MTTKRTVAAAKPSRRILVGTASWADPGFTEWYPEGLPARERLDYYAQHFDLVEVNSSFYAVPQPKVVASWVERTPDDFTFDFKLFQLFSRHRTTLNQLPRELRTTARVVGGTVTPSAALERKLAARIRDVIAPLEEAGKLGALLVQLTPSFGPRTHTLEELDDLTELFGDYKIAVELRHRGWLEADQRERTEDYFRSRRLAFVSVDAPPSEHFMVMPSVDIVTRPDLAYLRAHGRNTHGYIHGRTVAERFDYDYSATELQEIVKRAKHLAKLATEVHIIYNNNKGDYAFRAAERTRARVASKKRQRVGV
jgi:uncharacterized protein YecE (DUF72 family)